jgi:hypothetical protein
VARIIQITQDDGTVTTKVGHEVECGRRGQLQQRTLDRADSAAKQGRRRNGSAYSRKARSGKAVVARPEQRFTSNPQDFGGQYANGFSTR